MRFDKVGTVAIVLGCLLAIAGGASASDLRTSGEPQQPPPLMAGHDNAVVAATLGSYCWKTASSEMCADSAPPVAIYKRLTVSPGDRVSLRIGAPAAKVVVTLHHVAPSADEIVARLRSKSGSPSRRRWMTQLPADLKTGNVLNVSVQYAGNQGDAEFWVGLHATG